MNHRQRVTALTQENKELRGENKRLTDLNKAQAETIVELKKPKPRKKAKAEADSE